MNSYTDVFGGKTLAPAGENYRYITLAASTAMSWPMNYDGPDYIAGINNVEALVNGLSLQLPDATQVGPGQDLLIVNVGAKAFQVQDASGTSLVSVNPGIAQYFWLTKNDTTAGTWRTLVFGSGTSKADASALQGMGTLALNGVLNAAYPVTTNSSNIAVKTSDRAKLYAMNGGSCIATLNPADSYGNNFFFAVRNSGSGTVTVQPQSNEFIDGLNQLNLAPGESCFVLTDGAAWYSVGFGRSTQFQFTKLVKDVSAGGSFTLTSAEAAAKLLQFTGTPATNVTIVVPAVVGIYYVQNSFNGQRTLTMTTPSGNGIVMNNTDRTIVYCDGVNVVSAQSISMGSSVSIVDGSAGAPAINFSSDTDTGIFHSGTNQVGIAAGGAVVATFGSDSVVFEQPVTASLFNGNLNGTATGITGTLPITQGGTGATDGATALANLGGQPLLGYVPYNATNPAGFITGITGGMVTSALGYIPAGVGSVVHTDYGNTWAIYADANNRNDALSQIQIREQGMQGSTAYIGPRLSLHWGGVAAVQIGLSRDGWTQIMTQDGNNYGIFRAGTVMETSDERLKENWEAPEAFVDRLANIEHYGAFNWKDGGKGFGVGAQSLAKIAPRSVVKDDDGYLTVHHGGFAAVAVIELAKRLIALEEKLGDYANR